VNLWLGAGSKLLGKRGKPFERVVKEVLSALDPKSVVRQGHWVTGPDGRRELDVLIEGSVEGVRRRVLVECKDFNPKTTGPVGIGFVDALESKRRDLAADISFLCSNAGFTTDATRKAKRVGIGLIGVLRERDHRIRFQVKEEIYIRLVRVQALTIGLVAEPAVRLDGVPFEAITFRGVPLGNWVLKRAMLLIGSNPIVSGTFKATHALRAPVEFDLPSGPVIATRVDFTLTISGGWFAQQVGLYATAGIYDWLRRRVRLAPGPGQFHIKDVDLEKGEPIDCPPDSEVSVPMELRRGEMWMNLLLIKGLDARDPAPPIDELVVPEDLDLVIKDLQPEEVTSSCDYR
jgi:restriction endonuclease